jgi:pimeloyl-ACP methyl ester carboxylesterase
MDMQISSNPRIAKLYRDVPAENLAQLIQFRERFTYQEVALDGILWRYIDSQIGDTVLFIPAGGTNIAEVSFKSINHFAEQHRVIAPDYPPIDNLEELFAGFMSLLDHLGVNHFYALGGSYGGWMVQSMVRMVPQRLKKLVITAVGPPDAENSEQLASLLPWLRITPTFILRSMLNRTFSRLISQAGGDPNLALLLALVKEVVYFRLDRNDILASMDRLIDQTRNYTFSAEDLNDWSGRILLVFGSNDPASPPEKRAAMKNLYPQAELKVIEGGEHGIAISHQDDYFGAIDQFLMGAG